MAYRLVGQDCGLTLADGGTWDGDNTLGVATNVKAFLKSVRAQDSLSTHDVTSLGDTREKKRPRVGSGRLEVELQVMSGGVISGYSVGNVAQAVLAPLSTGGTVTYTGIVVENSVDVKDGETIQRIVIDADCDGTVA